MIDRALRIGQAVRVGDRRGVIFALHCHSVGVQIGEQLVWVKDSEIEPEDEMGEVPI